MPVGSAEVLAKDEELDVAVSSVEDVCEGEGEGDGDGVEDGDGDEDGEGEGDDDEEEADGDRERDRVGEEEEEEEGGETVMVPTEVEGSAVEAVVEAAVGCVVVVKSITEVELELSPAHR